MINPMNRVALVPENFVDKKAPDTKEVFKKVEIVVCTRCDGVELDYEFPAYTCPNCGEEYVLTPEACRG